MNYRDFLQKIIYWIIKVKYIFAIIKIYFPTKNKNRKMK